MGKTKYSYGIALCKMIDSTPYIFLLRRRLTYDFIEFVLGKYDDWFKIKDLLNNMTASEKLDIMSGNFIQIWWRLSLDNKISDNYKLCEKKYNLLDKALLKDYIKNSIDGEQLWEMPKGRIESHETPINAAIRETSEEVGVSNKQYKLLNEEFNYITMAYDVRYHMKFYLADVEQEIDMTMKRRHIYEVDTVRWFSINDINSRLPYYTLLNNILLKYKSIKTKTQIA